MLSRVAIRDYTNIVKASNGKCFTPLALLLSVAQQYLNQWRNFTYIALFLVTWDVDQL